MDQVYGNRFAAFIDILGFKQMISEIEAGAEGHQPLFKRLKSVLSFLHEESIESDGHHDLPVYEVTDEGMIERELGNPQITYVSDCAIVSTEGTPEGFKALCNKLTKLSTDLACDGMFVRGGIAYGPLFHDKTFVFGSAYQRAYEVESKIAIWPRIVIDSSALEFMREHDGVFPLNDFGTRRDGDGQRYLHPFPFQYHPYYTFDWLGFLLRVKGHILASLNKCDGRVSGFPEALRQLDVFYCWKEMVDGTPDFSGDNPKVLSKYLWLKDEFNRTLVQHEEFLVESTGKRRIAPIVDCGTHWGPERILGRLR